MACVPPDGARLSVLPGLLPDLVSGTVQKHEALVLDDDSFSTTVSCPSLLDGRIGL